MVLTVIGEDGLVYNRDGIPYSWSEVKGFIALVTEAYTSKPQKGMERYIDECRYEQWYERMKSGIYDGIAKSDIDIARILKSGSEQWGLPETEYIPDDMKSLIDNVYGEYIERYPPKKKVGGYVYLAQRGDLHKIGFSGDPANRAKSLGANLIAYGWSDNARMDEFLLHQAYDLYRRNGEWFHLEDDHVDDICMAMNRVDAEAES